jgi:hypothetical protein
LNNSHKIDSRTIEDIKAQIAALAASYTPEWVFTPDNPDAGSVIGLIFSRQLSDTIDRLNRLPDKYRTEFINMLNIGLLPAYPAQGIVVFELIRDTVAGVNVTRGTKLLGSGENGENTVFETICDIYITNSRLTDIVGVMPESGRVVSIMGGAAKIPLIVEGDNDGDSGSDKSENSEEFSEFKLFDFAGESIERNALIMHHSSVFDTGEDIAVSIRLESADGESNESLCRRLTDSDNYRWSYFDGKNLEGFEKVSVENDVILLQRSHKAAVTTICLESLNAVVRGTDLKTVQISSACDNAVATLISHNESEMDCDRFMPFGEQASVYDECYIGHDKIFSQCDATITFTFKLNYKEKLVTFTPEQMNEQLKVIKRKPRRILYDTANTCIEKVSFEYFNGTGWKRLAFTQDWTTLFDGNVHGDITMSFVCPDDWQAITIGAATERVVRIRVTQADNCYLQPCIHNMPLIKQFKISYLYSGEHKLPSKLEAVRGVERLDLTQSLILGEAFTALSPMSHSGNSLYLGFDRKIEGSPFSLFFDMNESPHFSADNSRKLRFEYSTAKGFSQLRTLDNTRGLSDSGTILFMPSSDFVQSKHMGQKRYWLRITDEDSLIAGGERSRFSPVIKRILLNAAPVHNVRTMDEEDFYIESAIADMSFVMSAKNILNAQVFVNEKNLSQAAKLELLEKYSSDDLAVKYDILGRISDFFVKWSEVANFDNSTSGDRHYVLDRMNNSIRFGDGINVRIPTVTDDAAFTVRAGCCDGAAANLPAGSIDSVMGNILYIDRVYNPIAAYAGDNIESIDRAIARGTNMLSSKNRLVSEQDFIREVKAFSGAIAQVKCAVNDDVVTLAILTHDYNKGSFTFNGLCERLRRHILQKSELTLTDGSLKLIEPCFVSISVNVWVEHSEFGEKSAFETHRMIIERLSRFIEPDFDKKSDKDRRAIGEIPTVHQLKVMLDTVQTSVVIKHFSAVARYVDCFGENECDLGALTIAPFMFCVNGEHKVQLL